MIWDCPQPFPIEGWFIMDGAGGGFIAPRQDDSADKVNIVRADKGFRPARMGRRGRRHPTHRTDHTPEATPPAGTPAACRIRVISTGQHDETQEGTT